ncbi:hypothetical protein [Streptomyces sp. NBC_00620]|uniref:hypothetical protein n=1 Tax=Streptomyces sp. NBC_00620 TaxID=2903666 RepID=UPI002251B413|nr:hypothetical protein [Streptomyces sp. NBC_00620]MCX4974764.1 hypothetical protein [Streptomyces sp. NBC_00620]
MTSRGDARVGPAAAGSAPVNAAHLRCRRPPGIMDAMDPPITDWITIAAYENLPGRLHPMAATRA